MFDMVLAGLTWKSCLVYVDDIIVFSPSFDAHMLHLDGVLERLYRAGLSLKLEKCHFCKDTVSYLGHVIRPGKLAVAEKNTLSVRTIQPPPIKVNQYLSSVFATRPAGLSHDS
jgi:Reverse transcriptase (RNA-dependent DNA polymerase)